MTKAKLEENGVTLEETEFPNLETDETEFPNLESDETQLPKKETEPVKKGPKGMRKSVPPTPERLEILARAREKALAVRKANAEARGLGKQREEAKQKAEANKKQAEDKFNEMLNKRVDEEIQKRLNTINDERMNELLEEKLANLKKPSKPKKKVVYTEETDESEAEQVIVRKKKQPVKQVEPEPPKVEPEPQRVEYPKQPVAFNPHQHFAFVNGLRARNNIYH